MLKFFLCRTTRKAAAAPAEEREYLVVYEETAGRSSKERTMVAIYDSIEAVLSAIEARSNCTRSS